jgi:hypothetical protein
MSFFGSIGKFLGGVAKAGLGIVTHGVSDQILGALKSRGDAKKAADAPVLNAQQEALANKMAPLAPRVQRTEYLVRDATVHLSKRSKPSKPSKRSLMDPTIGVSPNPDYGPPRRQRLAPRQRRAPRSPAKARTGTKRAVPSGGLDLKRISAMWTAEGKPGTWLNYIKAHSDVRKA